MCRIRIITGETSRLYSGLAMSFIVESESVMRKILEEDSRKARKIAICSDIYTEV